MANSIDAGKGFLVDDVSLCSSSCIPHRVHARRPKPDGCAARRQRHGDARRLGLQHRRSVAGQGPIDYIAQNGIQVSFGGSATVKGNTVPDDWYTPSDVTACGLLFFQAGGVKQSANNLFGNKTNISSAGRGGGNTKP